jgi:hypothetical protein
MPLLLDPTTLLLVCVALVVLVALTGLFVHSPAAGFGLLAAGYAWHVVSRGKTPTWHFGLDIGILDVLVASAALAAVVSLVRRPTGSPWLRPGQAGLALLVLLTLGSLAEGVAVYGLQQAGNDARANFLHVLGAACYAATVRPDRDLTTLFVRVWTTLAFAFVLWSVLGWFRFGIGDNSTVVVVNGELVSARPVDAAAALVIGQAAMALLCRSGLRRSLPVGVLLFLAVLLLQHRTVWVATAVMLGGWLLFRPGQAVRKAVVVGAAAAAAAAAVFVTLSAPSSPLVDNLANSASDDGTLEWRIAGWTQLLDGLHGVGGWLFGLPFGSGYERLVSTGIVVVSPHNYHLLLRVGLLGLVAMALAVLVPLRSGGPDTRFGFMLRLLVVGEAFYCLTYAPVLVHGLLLGLLLRRTAQRSEHVRRPRRAGAPRPDEAFAVRRTADLRLGTSLATGRRPASDREPPPPRQGERCSKH